MSEIITKQQNELAKLIERYSVQDGVHATAIPTLFFIRRSKLTGPSYEKSRGNSTVQKNHG